MRIVDRKLEIFRMAAQLRHFSETAALGMTQPNVTRQIALLEQEFGTPLFDRNGRRLTLTPAGRTLSRECDRLFAEVGEIRRRVGNAAKGVRHYRIGGTMTAGGYLLPELVGAYMAAHPQCNIGIHVANTSEIEELLKSRGLNLALVEGPFDPDFFLSAPLLEDRLVPIAAPGVLPERMSIARYIASGEPWILREEGSGTRYHFDAFLGRHNLPTPDPDRVIVVNSFDALKRLVRAGRGISVISELAVADELRAGTLAASAFTEGDIVRAISFLYRPDENLKFAERFLRFARDFKSYPGR